MKTIVIGGGLVGLSTAQALISRGEEVQVHFVTPILPERACIKSR